MNMAAALADMTIKVEADELKDVIAKIEKLAHLELAFGYLLQHTPCICEKKYVYHQCHEAPCKVAIALDIAGGLRSWPADDK